MLSPNHGFDDDRRLNALFQAYRNACSAPEPSANFMPDLWKRIEAAQKLPLAFGRMARFFVTSAAGLSLAIALYLSVGLSSSVFSNETYIEALVAGNAAESLDYFEPVHLDLSGDSPGNEL